MRKLFSHIRLYNRKSKPKAFGKNRSRPLLVTEINVYFLHFYDSPLQTWRLAPYFKISMFNIKCFLAILEWDEIFSSS